MYVYFIRSWAAWESSLHIYYAKPSTIEKMARTEENNSFFHKICFNSVIACSAYTIHGRFIASPSRCLVSAFSFVQYLTHSCDDFRQHPTKSRINRISLLLYEDTNFQVRHAKNRYQTSKIRKSMKPERVENRWIFYAVKVNAIFPLSPDSRVLTCWIEWAPNLSIPIFDLVLKI